MPDVTSTEITRKLTELDPAYAGLTQPAQDPEPDAHTGPQILTYSQIAAFRNCRRLMFHGYEERLEPIGEREDSLRLGTIFHDAIEVRDLTGDPVQVQEKINASCPNWASDPTQRSLWHRATAMLKAYQKAWGISDREFTPFIIDGKPAIEYGFRAPIINPATGAASRSFLLGGKVDAIVLVDGRPWLLERKTATTIDAGYLEKLWLDLQITLYTHYLRRFVGIDIAGVIYDVAGKPGLKQAEGETEEEFHVRSAELAAKNKSGKSSAKRKMPETDDEFQARLAEWFAGKELEPGKERFHRERILITEERVAELQDELWEFTKQILDARRRGMWYRNTSQCFAYNRPCRFLALCRAGSNAGILKETLYRVREAVHPELVAGGQADALVPGPF